MLPLRSVVVLVALVSSAAFTSAATPPQTLTLQDLSNRPDRWPAQVTIQRALNFGASKLAAGQKVAIVEYNGGSELGVDAGNGQLYGIDVKDCDLLEAANAAWAKLTPEQRALEPKAVIEDASLWPAKVRCTSAFTLNSGKEIPPNQEFELLSIDRGGQVTLWTSEGQAKLSAQVAQTDVVARARELVTIDPAKRPARIANALKGKLVDPTGKRVADGNLEDQKLFALYYGASWCGPCRQFSPSLVKYINSIAVANPKLTVVLMSNDEKDADMLKYMQEEKMPWVAMPMKAMQESPIVYGYLRGSIPQLTIVDRYGKVLADSWSGNQYVGPKPALVGLEKVIKSGAAK